MKSETILILAVLTVLVVFAGSFRPSCSIRPAIINWERREKPIFPLRPDRKKDAVPSE